MYLQQYYTLTFDVYVSYLNFEASIFTNSTLLLLLNHIRASILAAIHFQAVHECCLKCLVLNVKPWFASPVKIFLGMVLNFIIQSLISIWSSCILELDSASLASMGATMTAQDHQYAPRIIIHIWQWDLFAHIHLL